MPPVTTGGPRPPARWRPGSDPPDSEREGGPMVRRALMPLTLAVAAMAAATFAPIVRAGAANWAAVTARDSFFSPSTQTVPVGDTLYFVSADGNQLTHSATSDQGLFD